MVILENNLPTARTHARFVPGELKCKQLGVGTFNILLVCPLRCGCDDGDTIMRFFFCDIVKYRTRHNAASMAITINELCARHPDRNDQIGLNCLCIALIHMSWHEMDTLNYTNVDL